MKRYEIVLVATAVFVALGVRLYFYTGLMASDDLSHIYGSYRLVHPETQDSFQGVLQGSANIRRLGVNVPIGLSMLLFGVHEWSLSAVPLCFSLAGVVIIYGACRLLAGPGAGVLAAWMWALLPTDVYTAAVCLQDNIFATVNATVILFLAASEKVEKRKWIWALAAGLALGYLQYVKEVGWMILGMLCVWSVYSTWAKRRIEWRIVFIILGFVIIQGIVACYYWMNDADPLSYWKLTLGRLFSVYGTREATYPFPAVFGQAYKYLCRQWVLGYAVIALPLLAGAAFCSKRTPARMLLFMLLCAQGYIWLEATKWMNWTQRYTLQLSTLYIALTVVGVHALVSYLPERWAKRMMVVLGLILLAATGAAMQKDRQQHGRFRGEVIRRAFDYVEANANDDDVIYFDVNTYVPFYTKRMFETLAGFEQFKGGFGKIEEAYEAKCGWVVVSHLEQGYMYLRPELTYHGPGKNWLETFRATNYKGKYFARVFKILPGPLENPPKIIEKPIFPADPPDISKIEFEPVVFEAPFDRYTSSWKRASREVTITEGEDGLSCTITGDPESDESQYGGVKIDVAGMKALKLKLSLTNPKNVRNLYVYAYGRKKGQLMRWHWSMTQRQRTTPLPDPMVFASGCGSGYFKFSGDFPAEDVKEVHVFVRIESGTEAGFVLHSAELATCEGAAEEVEEGAFEAIELQGAPKEERLSNRIGASRLVELTYADDGSVHCTAKGDAGSEEHQFGGMQFDVPGLKALRFTSSFVEPQNIVGMWVDGCDERGRRVARWEWRFSSDGPGPAEPITHVLTLGKSSAYFESKESTEAAEIRSVHIFIRLAPGAEAGFVVHSAAARYADQNADGGSTKIHAD